MEIKEISHTARLIIAFGSAVSTVFILLALVYIIFADGTYGAIKTSYVINGLGLWAERSLILSMLSALIFETARTGIKKEK